MNAMKSPIIVFLISVGLLLGCEKAEKLADQAASPTPPSESDYSVLKSSDVLVTVNGVALTKRDVEEECEIQSALVSLSKKPADAQIEKMKARLRSTAIRRFVLRRALLEEAAHRAVSVSDSEFDEFSKTFAKQVLRGLRGGSYSQITNRIGSSLSAVLNSDLRQDCLYKKVYSALREDSCAVISDEEVAERYKQVQAYNVRAAKAEQDIFAQATNVWESLNKGESFEDAVNRLTGQVPQIDVDMEWGMFQRGFFAKDDPEIYAALGKMGPGDYSPPVLGNGGLIIFMVTAITPPDNPTDVGGDRYSLAKIFFALPEKFELTDLDQFRKDLAEELTETKLKTTIQALQDKLVIKYPNGKIVMRKASTK